MKKLFFLLLLLISYHSFSNYITPGTGRNWTLDSLVSYSGGNVTFSGGIYFVNDTVYVSSSDTLKILNNTTVKLAYLVTFNFIGTLIINPPDSVKITSIDTTEKFYELRLDSLSDASSIRKTIFEYSTNGMRLLTPVRLLIIVHSVIIVLAILSTTVPLINLFRANPIISNCKIYRNAKVGIGGGSNINNAPQILNNIIYENNTANGNVPQINLGASGSATTIIRGNTILGLYTNAGGIATLPTGTLNITIENNIIKYNRYGIAITNANTFAIIRNNIIDSNNIQGNPALGGSGINFNGNTSLTALVSKNTIRGNLWGITIQGTALPNFGDLSNADTNHIGLNNIYNNSNTGRFYDLFNNTPDSIKAENNYWGTSIADSVEAHIFHKPDSAALGFVDFMPINSVNGIIQSTSKNPSEFNLYNAYPNPFNPETKIKFDIALEGNVKLSIYDITGRQVTTLLNEQLRPGTYEAIWNASNYSSGIYFYHLETNNTAFTKKMVLIK